MNDLQKVTVEPLEECAIQEVSFDEPRALTPEELGAVAGGPRIINEA